MTELPGRDAVLTLESTELYAVGGLDGEDWQAFGESVQVGIDERGTLRVLDADNFRVLAIANGALQWRAGQEGGGPGEFGMPMAMALGTDGTATIYDIGHQAFVQFDAQGNYLEQTPHGFQEGMPGRDLIADPEGGVLFSGAGTVAMRRGPGGDAVVGGGADDRRPLRRVLAGARDGVAYDAWQLPAVTRTEQMEGGGASFQMRMPALRGFEPGLFYAPLSGGRLVVVDSTDYSIKMVGSDGTVARVLTRPFEPRPVGRAEREADKQRRLAELEEGGGPQMRMVVRGGPGGASAPRVQSPGQDAMRQMLEGRIENMVFAEVVPVISAVRVDPWSERVWIRRTGDRVGELGPIDVITTDGTYLGTLSAGQQMPAAFGPDGLVAYMETDEFDVTTIRVARMSGFDG